MKRNNRYLVAGGGHGRVVLDSLLANHAVVDGIIDAHLQPGSEVFGVPVLGDDRFLENLIPSETRLINGFGVSKNTDQRMKRFKEWFESGFKIEGTVHPAAVIGLNCSISFTSQIMAGVTIQNSCFIGENAVVNTGSSVDHDVRIEMHVFVSPGVTLCGSVLIKENVFIGAGTVVLPGVTIHKNAIVGAGSVVVKDVEESTVVYGNPARKINRGN